jgi:hypothetical protein
MSVEIGFVNGKIIELNERFSIAMVYSRRVAIGAPVKTWVSSPSTPTVSIPIVGWMTIPHVPCNLM